MQITKLAAVLMIGAAEAWSEGPVRKLIVSIPDRKIALIEDGKVVKIYPVAVGKTSTPSPTGDFQIITRIANPTWYGPGKIVPAGKGNPVGTRWIGLSAKGYGIHGTNSPRSIGKAASHGCIRMRNQDVEELFTKVEVGDAVQLVREPNQEAAKVFGAPAIPDANGGSE